MDRSDDDRVGGVAGEGPDPDGDPLLRHGEADHHLRAVVAVVLGVTEAAEVVVVLALEVGGGRVEQDHVDVEVQQVGDGEEDLPLERLVGVEEEVHRPVEDLGVVSQLDHLGNGDVVGRPLQGGELGGRGEAAVGDEAEEHPLDSLVEAPSLRLPHGSPSSIPRRCQSWSST